MAQRLINIQLRGLSPLLMHRDDVDSADTLEAWRKDPTNKSMSKPGDDRYPPWTWSTYLLHDNEKLIMPHEYVAACVCKAAASVTRGRQKTFKDIIGSSFLLQGDACQFLAGGKEIPVAAILKLSQRSVFAEHKTAAPAVGLQLYVKRVRVGTSKHVRVWPMFTSWEVRATAELKDDCLTVEVMKSIFGVAGKIGLGDRRPGSPKAPGRYGVFASEVKAA